MQYATQFQYITANPGAYALRGTVVDALKSRAATGIQVRIAFDHTRAARKTQLGSDPAPRGTQAFIEEVFAGSRVQVRPITGSHLMHNKYLIRDGNTAEGAVWTGSANWTDDGIVKLLEMRVSPGNSRHSPDTTATDPTLRRPAPYP